MTISNRISLLLVAGLLAVLAIFGGMGLHDALSHLGAGASVLVVAFACFAFGWIGGGDAASPRLRDSGSASTIS